MEKKKKKGMIIAIGAGLESFVDWVDPNASDPIKEREEDMSSLAVEFAARICKQAARAQGETTPHSEVSGRKRQKWYGSDEEAHKSLTLVNVDSLE